MEWRNEEIFVLSNFRMADHSFTQTVEASQLKGSIVRSDRCPDLPGIPFYGPAAPLPIKFCSAWFLIALSMPEKITA